MALERAVGLPTELLYPVRFICVTAVLFLFSRPYLHLRPSAPVASVAVGIAVFVIWIGPDVVFGPGYRHHWLFENSLTGAAQASVTAAVRINTLFIVVRVLSSAILVPMLEELFWRGWMMRWLISKDFQKVPLGTYTASAFWIVAFLFASEHGPYWEVGLAAGIVYNWWLIRTRNLADCILAHGVTNAALAAYVLAAGEWQYWL
jgi:CAAX prenyl protease-like protein